MDGAISTASGPTLLHDFQTLPSGIINGKELRCLPGNTVITGRNNYGQLQVPYVVHSVGPNYSNCKGRENKGDAYLVKAYAAAMRRTKEKTL